MRTSTFAWPWIAALLTLFGSWTSDAGEDWPMWRYDAQRSAASPNSVPESLQAIWKRDFAPRQPAWDDPLNLDLMTYDRTFEPIAIDGRLFIGFNDSDKLLAIDTQTGRDLWTAYAEAPVRLAPVAWKERVLFCSDDGYLYCVQAEDGKLLWKFSGAPNPQKVIGNRRLTSAWPARGGPVIRDDTVYFAASIWPFMGTFVYAIDAETGAVRWVNDNTGSQYIKQPHSAPSFAGVAPQGAIVATDTALVVPGGRSVPAVFDRRTGELRYFELNAGGKGTGGSFVAASDDHFYVHTRLKGTRAFDLTTGVKTAFMPNEPVLAGGIVYSAEVRDETPLVRASRPDGTVVWELEADGSGDLILAGDRLVAGGPHSITLIRLPQGEQPAAIISSTTTQASVDRLLVADQKLFAVSIDGSVTAYGDETLPIHEPVAKQASAGADESLTSSEQDRQRAAKLLVPTDSQGYAFWFGEVDTGLVGALAEESPFVQLAVVDDDAVAIDQLRRGLDAAGLLGKVTAHHSPLDSFRAPSYVANVVFIAPDVAKDSDAVLMKKLYESVRPYGGVMHLMASASDRAEIAARVRGMQLEQAAVEVQAEGVLVRRVGKLPGSADWTHQHGDIANTLKSEDQRVKLPLGVLWFGGSSNTDVLPRHGHGPPEQVVGGRLFIQGTHSLSARDVYTGRVFWKREFDDLGTFDVYYDDTYEDTPLDPKYNQVHIPGASGRGTNYVVTDDRVYLLEKNVCLALDPATGKTLAEIHLPANEDGSEPEWGYIGVYKNVLIGGLGFANYRNRHDLTIASDKELSRSKAGFGSKSLDRAASMGLVAFDRHSGKQLWRSDAKHSFWHNGIVAGDGLIYCLDKNPSQIEEAMRRRGKAMPDSYRIVALQAATGDVQWEITEGVFGTWLGYSERHGLLLQAGARASDRLASETGRGMTVYRGDDGSVVWKNDSLAYVGPCILHNDLIITNANSYTDSAGAFYLETGEQKMVKNPLTGEWQPWKVSRAYGCNTIIASENMLTFRSGAAGFYDLLTDAGTGNLGGFKSGCTSNLVVANGVLNAPDYTRTCSCAYQNQTSLALVHMPEIDVWSVDVTSTMATSQAAIRQLAINFGAPGDRRDEQGQLWLEYPVVAEDAMPVSIDLNDEVSYFQHHSSSVKAAERPWILASGVKDVTELRIKMQVDQPSKRKSKPTAGHGDVTMPTCEVRLHFSCPASETHGVRIFDVYAQDQLVLSDVTLDASGKQAPRHHAHTIAEVAIADELSLRFEPKQGSPVLAGLEIIRKQQP